MKTIITLDKANQPYGYPQLDGSGNLPSPYGRSYKVYTALLTQNGGDNTLSIGSGALTKGVTYNFGILPEAEWDFSNVGGPVFPNYYSFVATSDAVPNSWGGLTLSYNTGAPVVTVLENTTGLNLYSIYQGIGTYQLQIGGDISIADKSVMVFVNGGSYTGLPGVLVKANYSYEENLFYIFSFSDGTAADGLLSDMDRFYRTSLEIKVYN